MSARPVHKFDSERRKQRILTRVSPIATHCAVQPPFPKGQSRHPISTYTKPATVLLYAQSSAVFAGAHRGMPRRTHAAPMPAASALAHADAHAMQHSGVAGTGACCADGSRSGSMQEEAEAVESCNDSRMSRPGSSPRVPSPPPPHHHVRQGHQPPPLAHPAPCYPVSYNIIQYNMM